MKMKGIILLVVMARAALVMGQSNDYCLRVVGHTPFYERILLPRGHILRGTLRGVDDLSPAELYSGTNRIDAIFADATRERTNGFYKSCLPEVPVSTLTMRCPGGLLPSGQASELLRHTVVVPRISWTNHNIGNGGGWRYVFSLMTSKNEEYVIDERPGACALVFFPDGTYRCVMDPNYSCLKPLQQIAPADASQPFRSAYIPGAKVAGPHRSPQSLN
jgi:hypothetical protein